jgi:hypothetical protein
MKSTVPTYKPGRPGTSPNYFLLLLGLALAAILVSAYLITKSILPPPLQALLIAGAMVLILYGIYPVPAIKGTFGKLHVAGPAALGLFIFLFVWKGLSVTTDRQFLVLQTLQDSKLNSAPLPEGATITLLDVDSLDDSKLVSVLDSIQSAIMRTGISKTEADPILAELYKRIIQSLDFGAKVTEALKLLPLYNAGNPDVDRKWAELVTQVGAQQPNPDNYHKRVRREPFAIVQVKDGARSRVDLVLPGVPIQIGGRSYRVPIIANPSLTVTRGIQEAIVLQLED